ncbi:sulfite exporter TauE/SafE family protein [Magnetofaba australis]|uniref:Probable membrane transporter protein n=1 Tax=Magnetofaba australis IT-1 TaxID=1434232 RepID=A0A1Y2K7Y7_9PROT|nr:sulfite exporter TauE/SafE family protein [Magnetofaba australis]OSM04895.1 putative permease [Magnetofaba australis IT-1]
MAHWQMALLALAGVAMGWINTIAGGGSLISAPLLLFLGLPAPMANGTNRIGVLAQSLAAVLRFYKTLGGAEWRLGLTLSAVSCIGALLGAMIGVKLDGVWFNRVLAGVMAGVLLLMASGRKESAAASDDGQTPHTPAPRNLLWGHLAMLGAGFWGGFIQIGVGFILMPALHRVMGMDLVRVNFHKSFIVLIYTLLALAVFASQGQVDWGAGAALALGAWVGGWLGAHTTLTRGDAWVRRALYVTGALFILKLLWSG